MRKFCFVVVAATLFAAPALAQRTVVSGTVKDTSGFTYAGASLSVKLSLPTGAIGAYLNGAQIGGTAGPITLDSTGSFLVQLADNTLVQCANAQGQIVACVPQTTWTFAVNLSPGVPPPLGTGPQVCTATLTITGASQSVSGTFSACPAISNTAGSVAITPTINAIYASPSCPSPTPPNCFTVFDDVNVTVDAVYVALSTTVGTQPSDPAFVAGNVGEVSFGTFNCSGAVSNCNDNCPQSTIQSVTDAHHVVVGIACTNSSSAALHSNNFFWGHDDGPTLVSAFAVILNGSGVSARQNLFLPCGMMFTSVPPFIVPSPIRNINGGITGCGGGGATVIVPLPKMNCNTTGACLIAQNSAPTLNRGSNLPGWVFENIVFWGGGTDFPDATAIYSNPATGILTSLSDELHGVYVIGWVWNNSTIVTGASNTGSTWLNSGSIAGGNRPCQMQGSSGVNANAHGGQCGGAIAAGASLTVVGDSATFGMYINQGGFGVTHTAGKYFSHGDHITNSINEAGGTAYLSGTILDQFGFGGSAITISSGVLHLNNVAIISQGAPVTQTGGTIFDNCGNVFPLVAGSVFTSGGVSGLCSLIQSAANLAVASRNTALASTALLSATRWPAEAIVVELYAYDSAAGASCTGNTTVVWTLSYTDPTGTAQTSTATETITTNGGATGGDALKVTFAISTQNSTAVNYSTTYTIGTGCVTGPSYAAKLKVA